MGRLMGTTLAGLALLFALLAVIWTAQRKLIYFPFGDVPPPRQIGLSGATAVAFPTADGLTLNGWFVNQVEAAWFTVIVFNGNAGNRALRAPLADALARHGLAVLLVDYRGFGGNPGSPTESGLKADSRAAREYALRRREVDPERIAYFGESLGSAVAVELASELPPAALILRSPFTSMVEVGQFHYPFLPVRWLLRDRFAAVDRISRIHSPLLIIAGEADRIVPASQSRRLYEAANDPKTMIVIPGADHNDDDLLAGGRMIESIVRFLRAAG
jgi:fermentation-respiration switch protein FrsA (DUF1100 family)